MIEIAKGSVPRSGKVQRTIYPSHPEPDRSQFVEKQDGTKSLDEHEYEFKSKEDAMKFFTPHFKNVTVFETLYPDRHNLYFWASNGHLPFSSEWTHVISSTN